MVLEGYTELNGDKDIFLEVPLVNLPDLLPLPSVCFAFGTISPGACIYIPDPNDPENGAASIPDSSSEEKRDLVLRQPYSVSKQSDFAPFALVGRTPIYGGRGYYMTCDNSAKTQLIRLQTYPVPSTVKGNSANTVPTMLPLISCSATSCPVTDWETPRATNAPLAVSHKSWSSMFSYANYP